MRGWKGETCKLQSDNTKDRKKTLRIKLAGYGCHYENRVCVCVCVCGGGVMIGLF